MPVTRNFFQKIPFIRITSSFLTGILINHYLQPDNRTVAIALVLLISTLILFWHNRNFTSVKVQNAILSFTIIVAGIFYPRNPNDKKLPEFSRKDYFLAEVCQKPAEKARTFQTILQIQNEKLSKPEKVVAYFSKSAFDSSLTTGDQLIILGKPQRIQNAGNPYEFDYKKMMSLRQIWFSVYLAPGTYLKTAVRVKNITNWAERTRDRLIARFPEILPDKEERSVISALTLGYRTEISQDTLDYFASTGAMHVLSVSGLHVALIYMILGFLLAFLKRGKAGSGIFMTIMILLLWVYAFLSGFSPPVQRATVMFTFVIIGNNIRRPVNIYNSLTASAMFLILLNPNVIFDVGFQLSYLAILGIVLIQPALNNLLILNNPILKGIWSLFTVSVAAQLITFPLGLFYFNQFSNIFWLSNFVVVPITTIIMWLTMAFFILTPVHSAAALVGFVIEKLTAVMLTLLKAMDAHPLAVIKGIVLSQLQVFLIYAIIVAFLVYGFSKRKQWLFHGLALIAAFQCTSLAINFGLLNQKYIFVYNTRNTLIHLINGRKNYLVTNGYPLSDIDQHTVQKVIDHLKLSSPIVIDKQNRSKFHSDDLSLNGESIHFLNCFVQGNKEQNYQTPKILTFRLQNSNPKTFSVYTENRYSTKQDSSNNNFNIKSEGAFHCRLQ